MVAKPNNELASVQAPSLPTHEGDAGSRDGGNWFAENVWHPLANAALIEPYQAIASLADGLTGHQLLPDCQLLSVPEEKTGSAGWIAQTVTGGAGMLLPLLATGRATGGVLKGAGRLIEASPGLTCLEAGGTTARFLASDSTAMVTGAGLYGGARDPEPGTSRLSNAVSTAVGFGAFEAGNSLTGGLRLSNSLALNTAAKITARAAIGAAGGIGQYESGALLSQHRLGTASGAEQALVAGAAMNSLLPAASAGSKSLIDSAFVRAARPISAGSFAARAGFADSTEISQLIKQAPLTRVKQTDAASGSNIDQKKNVIALPFDASPGDLAHELDHRITAQDPAVEARFKEAAQLLNADKAASWQIYRGVRLDQENSAIQAETRVADATAQNRPALAGGSAGEVDRAAQGADIGARLVSPGLTYDQLWRNEFDQFQATGGRYRPASDYAGDSMPSYEVAKSQVLETIQRFKNAEVKPYTVINNLRRSGHVWFYDQPGTPRSFNYVGYDKSEDGTFQRYWKAEKVRSDGTMWGGTLDIFNNPVRTQYGSAKVVETFADSSTRYHILTGAQGVPDNVVLDVYPGARETQFGAVTSIVHRNDGTKLYRKLDGGQAVEYASPDQTWFGSVASEEERPGGTTIYRLQDGNSEYGLAGGDVVEWHPNGLTTTFGAANSSPFYERIDTVMRGKERTTYVRADGTHLILTKQDHQLQLVDHNEDGQPVYSGSLNNVVEYYPSGLQTNFGTATAVEFTGNSTLYHTPAAGTDAGGAVTQVFDRPTIIDRRFDPISVSRQFANGKNYYLTANGSTIETYPTPTRLGFDNVVAVERATDGLTKNYTSSGSVIELYPRGIETNVGLAQAIERGPLGLKVTLKQEGSAASGWNTLEVNNMTNQVVLRDAVGNIASGGVRPADNFQLVEHYTGAHFPDGKTTPWGQALSAARQSDGSTRYIMADGRAITVRDQSGQA